MAGTAGKKIVNAATLNNFDKFMAFIDECLSQTKIDYNERNRILTASEEIIVNVINHAYRSYSGNLEIVFSVENNDAKITFIDSGVHFNPLERPEVNINMPLEEREAGGLGILMVKKLMDDVSYHYKDLKNHFTIVKHLTGITNKTEQ